MPRSTQQVQGGEGAGWGGGRVDVDLRTKQKCLLMRVFVF